MPLTTVGPGHRTQHAGHRVSTLGQVATDARPVTVLLPDSATAPIDLYESGAALRMAIVERAGATALDATWDAAGVYVLLDRHAPDGSWGCYVGQAVGLRKRLAAHVTGKDHWQRAILVQRDTRFGFNSAQIGWLEGRVFDLLDAAADATLHNGNRPKDETLPAHELLMLEGTIAPLTRVLRLIGYDASSPAESPAAAAPVRGVVPDKKGLKAVKLTDLIARGLLSAGTQLHSANGVWPATATVLGNGQIQIGDVVHGSLSAAAGSITQGSVNGWDFWAISTPNGDVRLATLRQQLLVRTSAPHMQ
jgi:hypothetical protein